MSNSNNENSSNKDSFKQNSYSQTGRRPGGIARPMGGMVGASGDKPKDFKKTLKRLLMYLKPQKLQLLLVVFFAILSTVFYIVGPKILGKATTRLLDGIISKVMAYRLHKSIPTIDFKYIGVIILILILLYIISSIFRFIQQYIMADVSQNIVYKSENRTYNI